MATSGDKERVPAEGTTTQTTTGGTKPLHRFLRAEPKSVGIVMMFMGSCLFMFGIPLKMDKLVSPADIYSSFWLGILYFTCGVVYVLAERQPTKKIITASLALSIVTTIGTTVAAIDFMKDMVIFTENPEFYVFHNDYYGYHDDSRLGRHYMSLSGLEAMFLLNSLVGGVILITMSVFARMALRSTRTQTVVVMRNLPAAE